MSWDPVGHRAPLKRYEQPRYTPPPDDGVPQHLRVQIEHMQKMAREKEGDRLWKLVVESATGG